MTRHRSLWDKTWKDKDGNWAIWQTPNVWLIGWAVMTCISLFVSGSSSDIFSWIGEASLLIWSLLEIFRGACYFRRLLGVLVLIFAVATFLKTF